MQNTAVLVTSEARVLAKAHKGLRLVAEGELKTIEGWLMYGAALNEGREMFSSDEKFGSWVSANLADTHDHARAAAMWAAGSPDAFKAARKAHPKVRTVRGRHAKTKAPATPKANIKFTTDDATHAKKLNALAVGGSTEGERENAQVKLDAFAGNFGMTSDEVLGESDKVQPEQPTVGNSEADLQDLTKALAKRSTNWLVPFLLKAFLAANDKELWNELMKGIK